MANQKYTIESVKQYFKEQGCELLEKKYKNNKTLMKYKCNCGNISEINFSNIRKGCRCQKCAGNEKLTLIDVKVFFEKHGCELLEKKYINYLTVMKYKCICGDINKITFGNFQQGKRCHKCGGKKITGKNSPHYNHNLMDEDRIDRRIIAGYKKWAKSVYHKNDYTCQKCQMKKDNNDKYQKINAHHIEGYAENTNLRLDINNGITFCQSCHHQFHSIYGKKNITRRHLYNFLKLSNL